MTSITSSIPKLMVIRAEPGDKTMLDQTKIVRNTKKKYSKRRYPMSMILNRSRKRQLGYEKINNCVSIFSFYFFQFLILDFYIF